MFKFIKKLFYRKKEIKKYSTTLTDAYSGENNKPDLNPEISLLINEIKSKKRRLTNTDLNKIINFCFPNLKNIEPVLYTFNKAYTDNMVFDIVEINFVWDKEELSNIVLDIIEVTYEMEFRIFISVKNFHEVFRIFNSGSPNLKEKKSKNPLVS